MKFDGLTRTEYVVVRNAGGRAEPAVRDIVVLEAMTEITDVVIVHHVGESCMAVADTVSLSSHLVSDIQSFCTPEPLV